MLRISHFLSISDPPPLRRYPQRFGGSLAAILFLNGVARRIGRLPAMLGGPRAIGRCRWMPLFEPHARLRISHFSRHFRAKSAAPIFPHIRRILSRCFLPKCGRHGGSADSVVRDLGEIAGNRSMAIATPFRTLIADAECPFFAPFPSHPRGADIPPDAATT